MTFDSKSEESWSVLHDKVVNGQIKSKHQNDVGKCYYVKPCYKTVG